MNTKSLSLALLACLSVTTVSAQNTHVDTIYGCSLYDDSFFCNHNDRDLMFGAAKEGMCCAYDDLSEDCTSDLEQGRVCGGSSYAEFGRVFWFNSPDNDESLCGTDSTIVLFDSLDTHYFTIDGPIFDSSISKVQSCPYYLEVGNYINSHSEGDLTVTISIDYSYNGAFYVYDVTDPYNVTPLFADDLPLADYDTVTFSSDQSVFLFFLPEDNGYEASGSWSAYINGQVDTSFVEPANWETYLAELQSDIDTKTVELQTALDA